MIEYKDTKISNVLDFLKWIHTTKKIMIKTDDSNSLSIELYQVYYRGQACKDWNLKPGVFRKPFSEHEILRKAELKLWNEVSLLSTYLEKLIYFQHYGLSTRLLDVTYNPLVALYFACCENEETDGAIYFGYKSENKQYIAEKTAKYLFTHNSQEGVSGVCIFADEEVEKGAFDYFSSPMLISPPLNNPRIEAQNGAFIMAPLLEMESYDNYDINRNGFEKSDFFNESRAIIDAKAKEGILKELSILGINCGSIYKDVSQKLKMIMQEEEWLLELNIIDNKIQKDE